jgi:geranylgeranyl pyrophosphate synthase
MYKNKSHFLQLVEQQIVEKLKWDSKSSFCTEPQLFGAAKHLCLANGAKRARPKLIYFFAQALDIQSPQIIDIAVTGEFIHNASLLHDDVIDNGTIRRGKPTVNIVWDNLTAVLAGDILLSESIRSLVNCPRVVAQEALDLVSEMTRATMLEAHIRNKTDITAEQWMYIANGKTASMFRWCGRSVGYLANNNESVKCFGEFGNHFGIAFQMADDLLDIQNLDSGKTPFADIRNRNPSYPIILAQKRSSGFTKDLTRAWNKQTLLEKEIYALGNAIISTGAAEETYRHITEKVNNSIEALEGFASLPGCDIIVQWAYSICSRFQNTEAV